jgi:hypothetical protein
MDDQSHRTLRRCLVRIAVLSTSIAASSLLAGLHAPCAVFRLTSLAFSMLSIVIMMVAACRWEVLGSGSLNGWDESIALSGVAVAARLLQQI